MKRYPKCNLKYDDTLCFCLEDGTGLIRASASRDLHAAAKALNRAVAST